MVQGIDTIIPVDVYVPGCPAARGLMYAILMLHEKIRANRSEQGAAAEDPAKVGRPNLPPEVIDEIAQPFGTRRRRTG